MGDNILQPRKRRRRKRKGSRRLSAGLARAAQRALVATEEDVRSYVPTELDLQIAEAMMGGPQTFAEIAEAVNVAPPTISRVFQDPIRTGWINRQLSRITSKRLGEVDLALYRRAVTGDVAAMRLYYQRHEEIEQRAQVHQHMHLDLSKFSEEQLDKIIHRQTPSQMPENAPYGLRETNTPSEARDAPERAERT